MDSRRYRLSAAASSDYVNQPELFDSGKPKAALEAPRYVATYRWHCPGPDCKGHQQQLLDWEFSAYQRRLPADDGAARAAIRQRWLAELCSLERQVYFYVGNQAKRRQTFSILGLVYPKR